MKTYRVEEMAGDMVVSHRAVKAETPLEAVRKVTGRDVQARRDERSWVRVADENNRAVFKYAFK
ncbi:hypothetical protein SAMN03159463_05033 [Mesorhizobium sp. NFR06]|jgi:hypothetical protein|uniref:hypothetical protein n=1 Tax=Mesorhizobium sp. NFR06 TaxID=1566290 RepID=UPI0008E24BB7|nr:hypothetical protein [Mesorhizobium sp. NFR06]SFP86942.1 hypothetical protein SAMN03159463_05033 [Mesorhizobium sp. NFR06]